jgi:hypothetical protein
MSDKKRVQEKATALGFSLQQGTKRGAGYVLINNANDDKPLGDAYTASLSDVERYLDSVADDRGIDDVEIETGEARKPPPSKSEIRKSLQGHPNADEIKKALQPPPPAKQQEQRRRSALDSLYRTVNSAAFDRLPEAEKEQARARLRAAEAYDERIKAAQLPKSVLPLREIGINPDHPFKKEMARQGRVFHKANGLLKTNLASRRDCDNEDYCRQYPEVTNDANEKREDIERQERNAGAENDFVLPDNSTPSHYTPAPNRMGGVKVESKPCRLSKADRQFWQRRENLSSAIRDALARKDDPAAGVMLKKLKDLLGHGPFIEWVKQEIGINAKKAQRLMKPARGKKS